MQTGNSLLRQYKEKKDKGCWVRPGPQAYYLVCEAPENTEERQEEGSRSAWWENEAPREGNEQSNPNTPLEPPSIERSRTASPYIENNVGGTGTVVRRRIIDQVPRDPATKVINIKTISSISIQYFETHHLKNRWEGKICQAEMKNGFGSSIAD